MIGEIRASICFCYLETKEASISLVVCSDSMVGFIHKFCSSVFSFTALFSVMQRNGKLDFNVICYLFSVKMILQFSIYYVLDFETAEFFCGHVVFKRCLGTSLKFALSWLRMELPRQLFSNFSV